MAELDPRTRAQLRALTGPSPEQESQLLASIWARLDAPDPDGDPDPDPGPDSGPSPGAPDVGPGLDLGLDLGGSQVVWIAKIVGATAMLTGAGLLAVRLIVVSLGLAEAPRSDAPTHAATDADRAATAQATAKHESAATPANADRSAQIEPATSRPRPSTRTAATIDAAPEPPEAVATAPRSGSFADELALLQAAKARAPDDPTSALASLERHRQDFPDGVLAPERELLRVELSCRLGRIEQATAIATQLRREHAGSPLLERLASSCVGP